MIQVCSNVNCSTSQAAKLLKIGRPTLHRWVASGKLKPPKLQRVGGVSVRLWTEEDIRRVRKYKASHYRKGRGRKKAQKKNGNR